MEWGHPLLKPQGDEIVGANVLGNEGEGGYSRAKSGPRWRQGMGSSPVTGAGGRSDGAAAYLVQRRCAEVRVVVAEDRADFRGRGSVLRKVGLDEQELYRRECDLWLAAQINSYEALRDTQPVVH